MILQCALDLFAERGYDGAKTRDIASRAGVNHAMINYYFRSKEQLWKEAVKFLFGRVENQVVMTRDEIEACGTPREFGREFLRRYIRYCARHPEHGRIMMQECVRDGERLQWAAKNHIKPSVESALKLTMLLQREKVLPDHVPPQMLHYAIVGACQLIYTLAPEMKCVWNIDMSEEEAIEAHIETVLSVFYPQVDARSPRLREAAATV